MTNPARKYEIIYLEHESGSQTLAYRQAMEDANANVRHLQAVDALKPAIQQTWCDLVVTDAFFLPPNEDHTTSARLGDYSLRQIAEVVRDQSLNKNVKLVVLTAYSAALFGTHRADLALIDDVWEKGVRQELIKWHIERLHSKVGERLPNHTLLDRLLDVLQLDTGADYPWHVEIEAMVTEYRDKRVERDQVLQVTTYLAQIGHELNCGAQFQRLLGVMSDAEVFNVAAKPSGWGHLRHVLNVFWLGYYLLNCGVIDIDNLALRLFRKEDFKDVAGGRRFVNIAWLLAAVFHDLGLLGQRFSTVVQGAADLCREYKVGQVGLQGDGVGELQAGRMMFDARAEVCEDLESLANTGATGEAAWLMQLKGVLEGKAEGVDHGTLSASLLLRNLECLKLREVLAAAARACAVHNFGSLSAIGKNSGGLLPSPILRASDCPLTALLVLCDNIAVWDRDTGQESRFEGVGLRCAELAGLDVDVGAGRVVFEINYRPFRYQMSVGTEVAGIEHKLQQVLFGQVYAILDCFAWEDEIFPEFTIRPLVGGQPRLKPWSSVGA